MTRRTLSDYDALVDARATRFVRLHVAGRRPIRDAARRADNVRLRDRALRLLIDAVQLRDRAHERIIAAIARSPPRKPRGAR